MYEYLKRIVQPGKELIFYLATNIEGNLLVCEKVFLIWFEWSNTISDQFLPLFFKPYNPLSQSQDISIQPILIRFVLKSR